MEPISVLLVDDNPIFLRATSQFLEAHDDMAVIGTAERGDAALAQVQGMPPQVILIDLAMPGLPGLEVIPRLRSLLPESGIIALTLLNTNNFRQAALEAGADAFIPKATMRNELIPTIRRVAQNGRGQIADLEITKSGNGSSAARRILIMEDNADLRRLYGKALRQEGYEVHLAGTIQEADALLESSRFDVLLCDIHMGDDRSTDLLREHTTMFATSGTQVIMVSGQVQYRGMCEEIGADFFLEKPVALGTLVAMVNRLTARHTI